MIDSLHILIVDDRPDGILFLSEFLHTRRHVVEVSNDGQEALEAILRRHRTNEAYDLVFSALVMAKLDGLAILRNLRRRNVEVPAVLYSSSSAITPEISQAAKQNGCISLLEKPLSLQRIERVITDLLRRNGTSSHISSAVIPANQSAEDDKPFFGTSRVIKSYEHNAAASTPSQASHALEQRRRPSSVELQPTNLPTPPPAHLQPITALGVQRNPTTTHDQDIPTALPVPPTQSTSGSITRTLSPPPAPMTPRPASSSPTPPPPTTSYFRRTVDPVARPPTNAYTRRSSGLFSVPSAEPPPPGTGVTSATRRTISGVQNPVVKKGTLQPPTSSVFSTAGHHVTCASCQHTFIVMTKPTSYTMACVHCGRLNRIEPLAQ